MGSAVLVVDDEPSLRVMIARALQADGHTVVLAGDGMEAWGLIEEGNGPFDLLVVDMVMPRWDGTTLIRRVRAERPAQRILLITGKPDRTLDGTFEALDSAGCLVLRRPDGAREAIRAGDVFPVGG